MTTTVKEALTWPKGLLRSEEARVSTLDEAAVLVLHVQALRRVSRADGSGVDPVRHLWKGFGGM